MSFKMQEMFLKKCLISSLDNSFKISLRLMSNKGAQAFYLQDADKEHDQPEHLRDIVKYAKDSRIRYNCLLYSHKLNLPTYAINKIRKKIEFIKKNELSKRSIPLIVEKLMESKVTEENVNTESVKENTNLLNNNHEQFPFANFETMQMEQINSHNEDTKGSLFSEEQITVKDDVVKRLNAYNENPVSGVNHSQLAKKNDDLEFKIMEDTLLKECPEKYGGDDDVFGYQGTPNPNVPKSSIPCGGCGVLFHCQDEGLPGYIPSEEFCEKSKRELKGTICQRCYFLQEHNMALNVRISPESYKEALEPIRASRSLVIVVLDLLDAPCSVWRGLFDLIGTKRPVVVVGNKIDLIPMDNIDYRETIRKSLIQSIKETNLGRTNIRHVCVISAKTGFGVEDLITKLNLNWSGKGDIYIIGSTNSGKSSLFNVLLGSDLCKVAASNLVVRATASPWPGTTLNLLKFPLARLTGKKIMARSARLRKNEEAKEKDLMRGNFPTKFDNKNKPTLMGHVDQTFYINPFSRKNEPGDSFHINHLKIPTPVKPSFGINEKDFQFRDGDWVYDTPGTVQPDQFLSLLTHDELVEVLPREPIEPRSFSLHNSQSVFIGGLVRLDLLYTPITFITITICASSALPITIVDTSDASSVYRTYLGTSVLHIPNGSQERLKKWPVLKPVNLRVKGIGEECTADVVLSSAGFISIAGKYDDDIDLRAWTPSARGVYVRPVSMLPFAKNLMGKKKAKTSMHHNRSLEVPFV